MGSRGVLSRASAVLRTLLSHSGTALVLAWLLYVYVFHSLANLPVRDVAGMHTSTAWRCLN